MTTHPTFNAQTNIIRFLRELQDWIDRGMPKSPIFLKFEGICGSHRVWCDTYLELTEDEVKQQRNYLESLWKDPSRDNSNLFPFNANGKDYDMELNEDIVYQNPKRLKFVKKYSNPLNH